MKRIVTGALALLLITGAAQAQDAKPRKEGRQHPTEQLNLTADQKAKLQELRTAQKREMDELRKNDQITVAESKKRRRELHEKYQAQYKAILTPEQQQKMASFRKEHGRGGKAIGAEGRRDMKASLNLSQAQEEKMKNLQASFKSKHQAIRSNTTLSENQKKEQVKALAQQHRQEVKAILTPEQQQKMESFRKEHRPKTAK